MAARPVAAAVERERKFSAWPGFTMPELSGLAGWAVAGPLVTTVLDAVYWDTEDLRLVRWGVTLRHRTTDGDEGTWTLKLPSPPDGGAAKGELQRTEFDLVAPSAAPPAELLDLARAYVRTAQLAPVGHLQTVRRALAVRDGGGRLLAELDDDEVSVLEGSRVAARFREVEVEAAEGAPSSLMDLIADRLHTAGAGPADPTPKLARALGPRALAPPEIVVPRLRDDAPVSEVVQAAFGRAVSRLFAHDPIIRLDGGVNGVHQARVSIRRLRSDLRTFRPVLDHAWADALREDLARIADALGHVRDADVQLGLLQERADSLGADAPAARTLLRRLVRERAAARAALLEEMRGTAYAELLDRLASAARQPAFSGTAADRPAADVVPDLVRKPWEQLVKGVRALPKDAPPEALHRLRIRAKRARYAAEAAGLLLPEAAEHGRALAVVTDVLGEYHDTAVGEAWVRSAVSRGVTREQALAAGLMIAGLRRQGDDAVSRWGEAWSRAERRKVRRWLDR
jgi:CHAD domain-containing protein